MDDSHSGVLLPQVAVEWGYDETSFLEATCLKAGLPRDAWEDPAVRVSRFRGLEAGAPFVQLLDEACGESSP
jgi:AMMECR1 domain-containing protein